MPVGVLVRVGRDRIIYRAKRRPKYNIYTENLQHINKYKFALNNCKE